MTLTDRLKRYAELNEKRTQGEWCADENEVLSDDCEYHPVANCNGNSTCRYEMEFKDNAAFIAAGPAMHADLVAVVEENERLKLALELALKFMESVNLAGATEKEYQAALSKINALLEDGK